MSVTENIRWFTQDALPEGVKLVAVSKTKPVETIMEAYEAGQRIFGENRVQELVDKYEALPGDIEWHMIGHLQSNKVKYIAPFVSLVHGGDKAKLLKVIDKEARKNERVIDVLLQFHIASEETKFGFDYQEAKQMLQSEEYQQYEFVRVKGVMGMATFTDDMTRVRKEFQQLVQIFKDLKNEFFSDDEGFKEISMGMSNDYQEAIEQGSTMVRIGSLIFGERNYH